MKTLSMGMILLLLVIASSCRSPKQSTGNGENPFQGTWKIIHTRVSTPDTTFEREAPTPPSIKVVNATHFAIGRQTDEGVWGVGGRYEYDGDTNKWTEKIQYHGREGLVGETVIFDNRLEGDTLWYKSFTSDTLEWEETWRRIE